MNKELLQKYYDNRCNDEELKLVLEWFEKSVKTEEGKTLLKYLWDEISDEELKSEDDTDYILKCIHHKINLARTEELLKKSDYKPVKYKTREAIIRVLVRAAAILLLPFLGYGVYMTLGYQSARSLLNSVSTTYNEVFSSVDAISKVTLPDGSNVWLNHRSSLKYPAIFKGKNRTVELKGEGYFEIFSDAEKPFIVRTDEIQIKATGTTFNVMAYPEDDKIEVSLISGTVQVERQNMNGETVMLHEMKPTDLTVFDKRLKGISTRTILDDRYFSWKEGKLVFYQEPISEVVKKLNRWFNCNIQITDPELNNLTYTATFVDESLLQILELLSMVSPVSYSIQEREEIAPGSFSKRKIFLTYRRR